MKGCGHRWGDGGLIKCTTSHENHEWCSGWDPEVECMVDTPNPQYVEPKTVSGGEKVAVGALEAMAGRVEGDPTNEGFQAGLEASERSAATWTDEQREIVREALYTVCLDHAGGGEFTTEAVWIKLAGSVPRTKGMTAVLAKAKHDGWLDSTGKTDIASRGGEGDHGQRLTLWYSLLMRNP